MSTIPKEGNQRGTEDVKPARSKPPKPMPVSLQDVYAYLKEVSNDVRFRWSRRGVPHIIVTMSNGNYGVCYFKRHNSYRVFFPYLSHGQEQVKWDSREADKVAEYIKSETPEDSRLHSV